MRKSFYTTVAYDYGWQHLSTSLWVTVKVGKAFEALAQNLKTNAFCGITMDRAGNLLALTSSLGSRDNMHITH